MITVYRVCTGTKACILFYFSWFLLNYSISTKLVTDYNGILFLGPPRQRSDPEEVGGRER